MKLNFHLINYQETTLMSPGLQFYCNDNTMTQWYNYMLHVLATKPSSISTDLTIQALILKNSQIE